MNNLASQITGMRMGERSYMVQKGLLERLGRSSFKGKQKYSVRKLKSNLSILVIRMINAIHTTNMQKYGRGSLKRDPLLKLKE